MKRRGLNHYFKFLLGKRDIYKEVGVFQGHH